MTSGLHLALTVSVAALAWFLTGDAVAAPPSIVNLGAAHTPGRSIGRAITPGGLVVGETTRASNGAETAYIWTASSGMVTLGTFGGAAYGVSPGGDVVVGMALNSAGDLQPFRWTQQAGLKLLGTVGGLARGAGLDANMAGVVVGESFSYQLSSGDHLAFRWHPVDGLQSLGTLGGTSSSASAVNSAGTIVGWSNPAAGATQRAFMWTASAGMQILPGLQNTPSTAQDISDSGYVTGIVSGRPMLWRDTLLSADLGLPKGFGTGGGGNAVSNTGNVVGFVMNNSVVRAALWPLGADAINLDAWLDQELPQLGAYWNLEEATGITDDGMIVGYGTFNDGAGGQPDGQRAFLLDASTIVPEPALLPAALLATAVRRRRSGPAARAPRPLTA